MWRVPLLLLCLAAGSRQLSISEFSVPVAVEAGEDARLECKYDLLKNESERGLFVKWWWTPLNSTSDQRYQLYQRIYGLPPEAINRHHQNIEIAENDGIMLLNVSTKDSGIYECEVSNIDEVREHKKLIVYSYGNGPLLNVTVVEDQSEDGQKAALVTCEAFDVAPYPDISITLNGIAVKSSGFVTELEEMYDIFENATISLEEADDGEFRCEILFVDTDVPHAPFVASQIFTAPTASPPEPEEAVTEPSATAPNPNDSGSNKIGDSWMLLTLISLGYLVNM